VTGKGNGAAGLSRDHRDAAENKAQGSTRQPTWEEAFAGFRTFMTFVIGAVASRIAPEVFTQHDLPPDAASQDAYQRIHRAHLRAGVTGWTKQGAVRAVTADAWRAYVAEQTAAARARPRRTSPTERAPVASTDAAAELDAIFGIRRRAS
jgi:hypothetical protein